MKYRVKIANIVYAGMRASGDDKDLIYEYLEKIKDAKLI